MKRNNAHHDHAGSADKRARSQNHPARFEMRALIPSKVAGSLIGKAGCNIQKLRQQFAASVRIPDCPGPERVIAIAADTVDAAIGVLEASLPHMTDEAVRAGPGSAPDQSGGQLELRLLIHQSIIGAIIGKEGFKIKEIREASGANIKVYQICAPQSADRTVAVSGTANVVVSAVREIFKIVEITEIKGIKQPYEPINFDTLYANEYGGYGGGDMQDGREGNKFSRRDHMMHSGRAFGGNNRGFRGNRPRSDYGGGNHRGGGGGGGGFNNYDLPAFGGNQGGFGNYVGHQHDPYQQQNDAFCVNDNEGPQESTQVTIPKDMAGAIIGPGGSRIRKIRNDSKADIIIDEPPPGSSERIITIGGTKRQIQTAQYLLQQSVREHAGNTGGMGQY